MTSWIDPLVRALDSRTTSIRVFVRDDDAGWHDERLRKLLDDFADAMFPIDLAAIPAAASPALARALVERRRLQPLGVHQHGFAHVNHEPAGRPCEFGEARQPWAQRTDIAQGRRILLGLFGEHLDSIFTPPWNRCTAATGRSVRECGIRAISRDATAQPLNVDGLVECPIAADWFAKHRGRRLSREEWGGAFARRLEQATLPLGVMLHHAVMDDGERAAWRAVLRVLASHPKVIGTAMRDVVACSLESVS